jgi:hypothetical protein
MKRAFDDVAECAVGLRLHLQLADEAPFALGNEHDVTSALGDSQSVHRVLIIEGFSTAALAGTGALDWRRLIVTFVEYALYERRRDVDQGFVRGGEIDFEEPHSIASPIGNDRHIGTRGSGCVRSFTSYAMLTLLSPPKVSPLSLPGQGLLAARFGPAGVGGSSGST